MRRIQQMEQFGNGLVTKMFAKHCPARKQLQNAAMPSAGER